MMQIYPLPKKPKPDCDTLATSMDNNWVIVHSSMNLQKMELLRHILSENQINAVVLNRQDSIYPVIGEIDIYVKREDVIRAKKIISESHL